MRTDRQFRNIANAPKKYMFCPQIYLRLFCVSQDIQQLFPYATLTDLPKEICLLRGRN